MLTENKNSTNESVHHQEESKSPNPRLSFKVIRRIVILFLLLLAMLCFIPFPIRYVRSYRGAEYRDGKYIKEAQVELKVWKLCYLFKTDLFKGSMKIKYENGREENITIDSFYYVLPETSYYVVPGCTMIEPTGRLRFMHFYWFMEDDRIGIEKSSSLMKGGIFCTTDQEFLDIEVYRKMHNETKDPEDPDFDEFSSRQ